MKKKEQKPKRKQESELSPLSSELGSFGLEPPKIYRNQSDNTREQRQTRSRRVPQQMTLQEKRQQQNKRRKKTKLKRKFVYTVAMVVAIAAVIIVLSLTVFFKVNKINVSGNEIYTAKQVTAVLPIDGNSNLFLVDKKAAQKKLCENLPYIYNVEIKKRFPATIAVNITETPVVFSIRNANKTYTLLDDRMKVLENAATNDKKGSLSIKKATLKKAEIGKTAVFTDSKQKANLLKLTDAITRLELEKITAVYSKDINNNFIVYDNRITYKLGNLDKLDKKIYSALAATDRLDSTNPQAEGTLTIGLDNQVYFTEN